MTSVITTMTASSVAEIRTDKASRYLQQMAKHFGHKIPVTFDTHAGEIIFAIGTCRMAADDSHLTLTLTASEADQMSRLQEVVASHLLRFAFREELILKWRAA